MSKYKIQYATRFKKSIKDFRHKQQVLDEIATIINRLANDEILEPQYNDHDLIGSYKGYRECHIRPNLCLIYQKQDNVLILYCFDIGSHSELFKKWLVTLHYKNPIKRVAISIKFLGGSIRI